MLRGGRQRGVNNLVGTDRGGCNKYDIDGVGLVKSLSRPGGEAGRVPAPHICNSALGPDRSRILQSAFHQKEVALAIGVA